MAQFLRHSLAVAGLTISTAAVISLADSYTVLQNKLQNVTTSQAQVNVLTEDLYALAIRTRSGVEQTATAFARFDRSLKQMGKSQAESLRLTETVNKALIVSGSTTSEASSALLQLSQAFNAGKLQGDEFRAVAENMPIVLDAVAKVLKRPINEVKKLGTEGKITAKVLFDAFKSMETNIDATFAKTTPTVAQALEVLRTQASKFIGEMNKATGFTTGLTIALRTLGDNLHLIAGGLAIAGVAALAYFGPVLLNAVTVATRAVWLFTAAVAANPIGLLAVGAAAALTTIALFGDKIKVTSDGLITLKDVAKSAWAFIEDAASAAAKVVTQAWDRAINFINDKTNGMAEPFRKFGVFLLDIMRNSINGLVGFFVGAYNAIRTVWANFPTLMQGYFAGAVNFGADAIETLVNSWQIGLRLIATATESLAPDTSKAIMDALDSVKIQIPRMDTSAAVDSAKDVAKAFTDAISTDFVGNAADALMRRAKSFAVARNLNNETPADAQLRGTGENQLGKDIDAKAAKQAERREIALQKINAELNNEIDRMFVLQPMREAQARFDKIEENLITKKIKLTATESKSIKDKIQAIQDGVLVQQRYDALYQEAIGPAQLYNTTVEAGTKLLAQGSITEAQWATAIAKSKDAYENSIDPMRKYNQDLKDQMTILQTLPGMRSAAQQMLALERQTLADGTPDRENFLNQKREEITLLERRKMVQSEVDKIYGETVGAQQALTDHSKALNESLAVGTINLENYALRMTQLGVAQSNLNLQMQQGSITDVFVSSLGSVTDTYHGVLSGLSTSFGDFFSNISQGFSNSIGQALIGAKNLKEGFMDVARQGISSLIGGLVQLGIQWAVNAALGQTVAAASAATALALSTSMAVATAAAWAPAAAAVSLATFGANAAPAMAGITATNALSAAMALPKGFEEGGYTGDIGTKQIAGVVHGKEFVFDAEATSRIGRDNLEQMRSGAMAVRANSDSMDSGSYASAANKGSVSVVVENHGTPQTYEQVPGLTAGEVRLIARDVVAKEAADSVAATMGNPNSSMRKSMNQFTNITRR